MFEAELLDQVRRLVEVLLAAALTPQRPQRLPVFLSSVSVSGILH